MRDQRERPAGPVPAVAAVESGVVACASCAQRALAQDDLPRVCPWCGGEAAWKPVAHYGKPPVSAHTCTRCHQQFATAAALQGHTCPPDLLALIEASQDVVPAGTPIANSGDYQGRPAQPLPVRGRPAIAGGAPSTQEEV